MIILYCLIWKGGNSGFIMSRLRGLNIIKLQLDIIRGSVKGQDYHRLSV